MTARASSSPTTAAAPGCLATSFGAVPNRSCSRGVASILVAPVTGPNGSTPTLFAAVGKRDQPTAAMLRSDDDGETWVVDNGGKGIWFDGGNLPGGEHAPQPGDGRLIAIADRGPYAANPRLFAGDMTGCVWTRPLVAGAAWSLFACLPDPSRSPIRAVAVSSTGDVIIATSRMGLAGSRGGGTCRSRVQAGVWRFAVRPQLRGRAVRLHRADLAAHHVRRRLAERRGDDPDARRPPLRRRRRRSARGPGRPPRRAVGRALGRLAAGVRRLPGRATRCATS